MLIRQNPNANGADVGATANGASTLWECVDDGLGSEDDDTTYIEYSGGTAVAGFRVAGGLDGSVINSVTVESRWRVVGVAGENMNHYVRLSASYTHQGNQAPGTTYADVNSGALARPGGGSWGWADLNDSSFNIGVRTTGATTFKRVTRINALFDITPPPGGYVFFLLGLGAIAAGTVLLREMPRVAQACARRAGALILPREYERALLEWRAGRRRAYFTPSSFRRTLHSEESLFFQSEQPSPT